MIETVIQLQIRIDIALAMLIWLVQLIIYPAYLTIDQEQFADWHRRYMRTISLIVIPLISAQALCIGFQCLENRSIKVGLQAALNIVAWTTTFTFSVPCHNKLQNRGWDQNIIQRLIHTNWIRTISWSSVMVLDWF